MNVESELATLNAHTQALDKMCDLLEKLTEAVTRLDARVSEVERRLDAYGVWAVKA